MSPRLSPYLSLLPLTGALLVSHPLGAATLQTNVSYGATGAVMNVYVPDKVDKSPGVVVALHYCGGSASNAASWLTPTLAEQYGFIVIAPGLPSGDADGCWDVGSSQTQTHDGGSHSKAIVQMVKYAITKYGADATRVFAAGASSGAMMTNVLLGAYPDVFAAGSVLAGVPFGCWTAGDGWTAACADGKTVKTAQQWGDLVRNAYSGYTGARPRVQLFHGTADTTLNYLNLDEEIKQWTNVLGLGATPSSTEQNTPKSGWTRTNYKNSSGAVALQVSIGANVGHDLTGQGLWNDVIKFFGLDQDAPIVGTGGTGGQGGGVVAGGAPNGGSAAGGRSSGGTGPVGGTATTRGGASSGGAGAGQLGGGSNRGGTANVSGGASNVNGGATSSSQGGSTSASGGAIAANGGAVNTSGGAATSNGGSTTVAGGAATAVGGAAIAQGGAAATGTGGNPTVGGTGIASGDPPTDESGCSCRHAGNGYGKPGRLALLFSVGALGTLLRRRRRNVGR